MRGAVALGVLAAIAMPGCAGWDAEAQARDRAREWLDCDEVELEAAAETAWHARGCGRSVDVACSTSANSPHCIQVRIATRGGEDELAAPDHVADADDQPVSASDPVPATDPAPASETASASAFAATSSERALRAALDAHRDDLLACVSRDRVVVRATWTADGALTLALDGDLAGSAEEGCVRAALAELRAEGASAPGTLLHLVRR
ncbi:MAG: hypothetical protein M3Y87_24945 [Myxococcota bacterium]|nr:hypothetical protein [Myxococcota bacterium]